ncbi:MAG: ATP-grasp domain-containing protein [Methanobacteriota archaeon]
MTRAIRRILVAGFSTRHVAASAARAGYEVGAIDHFCDLDLKTCTFACCQFEELADLPQMIRQFCKDYQIDAVITTSGAEDLEDLPVTLLGTDPGVATRFLDKSQMQDFFEVNGFPVPRIARPGEFPAILKPCKGSGGWRNAIVSGETEIQAWIASFPGEPYLLQVIAPGIPTSVCCVTDGRNARALAANLQILRGTDEARFGFSGSLTPFSHPMVEKMRDMAEAIAAKSGCKGIIGIDFLVTDTQIFPIEVNPRFVATLDTIERATGLNLVSIHIGAFFGTVPGKIPDPEIYCIRKILFAPHDLTIGEDLSSLIPSVADIPAPLTFFSAGEAVISVFGEGPDETVATHALDKTIRAVSQYMR